jgi:hypothetical protein
MTTQITMEHKVLQAINAMHQGQRLPALQISDHLNALKRTMTVTTLYPDISSEKNLSPDHGGSKVDELCEQIQYAMKGWGVSLIRAR